MCLSIVVVALKYNGQQFPSIVSDRDLPVQFKRHGQWPWADWFFLFFFSKLFCFSVSHPYRTEIPALSLVNFSLCSPSRLPIIQGGTFAFLTPTLAMLSLPKWKCPAWTQNATLVDASSPEFIEVWQTRMREVYCIFSGTSSLLRLFAIRKAPQHGRDIRAGNAPSTVDLTLLQLSWCFYKMESQNDLGWKKP